MTATTHGYCSQISADVNEQMLGTTPEVHVWLALEHPAAWGARAVEESKLPASVKAQLAAWETTIPGARVQLIKQRNRDPNKEIVFFVGLAREQDPALYRFELARCEDLVDVDVNGLLADESAFQGRRHEEPLYLVCTNGKRDQCCAKFGLPVYAAMRAASGDQTWRTTHTGGHRFAPTMVVLPHGIMVGRVQADESAELVAAYRARSIYDLDRYRGRSCYSQVAQVAEGLLRQRTGDQRIDAYTLTSVEEVDVDVGAWDVEFRCRKDGTDHRVALVEAQVPYSINPASCGKPKLAASTLLEMRG